MSKEQQQAAREFRESAIAGTEDESAAWWTGALARPVPGLPDLPAPLTPDELEAMTAEEWQVARTNLGIRQTHDLEGEHWSDRAAQTITAQNLAARTQPDEAMKQHIANRARLGIKDSNSTVFGVDSPNPRTHQSPWTG